MTKRILSLILCLSMLLSIFAMTVSATETETPETPVETPEVPVAADFDIVGEWIHGTDVADLGAEEIVARCAANGVTDIYLLVKGTGGTLGYTNTQFTENITRERDVLQEMIDAGHAEGIRVHAWLVSLNDETYKANNPEAGLWHFVRERDNSFLAAYNEGYRDYMKAIVTELATNYAIDGIHLDYIRYNHLANGWSEEDFANLEAMGANVENVKYLIRKTFYQNQLDETDPVDGDYIFNAYRNGDPDALLIGQYRRQNVRDFGLMIRDTAKAINPDLVISGALMPEGGYTVAPNDVAFADLHYGQNYEDAAEIYDYIVPMAYSDSYGYNEETSAEWLQAIANYSVEKGNKVVMGFQSYYPATSADLQADVEAVRAVVDHENILGICHFRHTQFSYNKLYYDLEAGKIKVQSINTYGSAGWRWVRFEAAEGVTFTGAKMGVGFAADAPVEIAEDGSWIKIGYADDAAEEVLPTKAWGQLEITFEGAPVDPNARIAYARIWISSNESRCYNVYEEGLPHTVNFVDYDGTILNGQFVADGQAAETPKSPVRPAYRFMGWDADYSVVTGDMTINATYREIAPMEKYGDFEVVGDWIWGSDVAALGADTIAERSAKNGVTDIYLLVKGVGGTLGFNKTQFTDNCSRKDQDVLEEMIIMGHSVGIRVHAWLVTDQDETYKENNPDSGMWHYKRARDNANITPYDEGYNAYMKEIATELATNYDIDGIHLDYIRYNHLCNGWSETDFANLEAMGANIDNVKYLINKTFYADLLPEGESVDADYIFKAYRNGDTDALLIAQYRRQNVVNLAKTVIDTAKAINPDLIASAAFMPEGAVFTGSADRAFADLHYGQNYVDGAEIYDYIIPMAYSSSYGYTPADMAQIAENVVAMGADVVMGLQSNYPITSSVMTAEIEAIRQASLENVGILGICHFRHTMFSYAKFTYSYYHGTMDVDVINTYATAGYKWIQIDAAEGVTFTGAEYGEGFVADAPIEIAEDGSYVKFGYASDGTDEVLPTLGEGSLKLTFEGAPADPKAPVAVARIWISSNESRAYNVYNDITPVTHFVTFKDYDGTEIATVEVIEGEAAVIDNPLRAGYRFMGWDADVSAVTEDMTVTATYREIAPMEQYGDFEIVGEWIHGSDVASLGADTIVERCAKNGITDIYLLVKGTGGTLGYNKTQYTENITRERDVLEEMILMGHSVGIRVHAWLVTVEDSTYKANNPESGIWHYVRAQDNDRINPYDEGYQTYMANIATEIATGYDVDGIHLDYIRYNHLANGWSETDFANLEAMGADIDRVKYLINKTFYADQLPEGETVDSQYIFNAYRNGDPDALLIGQYRRQNVVELAKVIVDAAKAVNPDLIMSAALMPEGAVTEGNDDIAFADLHYGQNYEDALELYDYVCPMAYTGSYADGSPEWFAGIAQYAADLGNKVVMGTQAYYPAMSTNLTEEVEAVRQLLPNENILGIVHFRHTQFSYAKFNYSYNDGSMTVDIINTYASAGYKWVQIDAAEGVKFTAAEYGEGFVADAPIEIAEDGSYVKFGYASDGEDFIIGALEEGTLKLTFEGTPADLKAPVAIARIYITNESRAFNVYNDLTKYEMPFVDVKEGDWFYEDVLYTYITGLMNGVKETVFAPDHGTTRAQMATILYRMAGSPSVEGLTTPFTDIVEGEWYYDAVVWGYNNGVIKGTSATTFSPDRDVTREQLVTLIFRYSQEEPVEADLSAYPDADSVSEYAREAMAWAIANGIINGVKNNANGSILLKPAAGATRAQIATIFARYCRG